MKQGIGKEKNSDLKKPKERRLTQIHHACNPATGEMRKRLMREGKYEAIQSLQVLEDDDVLHQKYFSMCLNTLSSNPN